VRRHLARPRRLHAGQRMPPRRTRHTSGDENHVRGPRFERTLDRIHRRSDRRRPLARLAALRPRRNAHPSSRRQRPLQSRQHVTAQQTRVFRPLRRRSSALARHQLASPRALPSFSTAVTVYPHRLACPPAFTPGPSRPDLGSPDDGRESPARASARDDGRRASRRRHSRASPR